jgi:hypothetical protein
MTVEHMPNLICANCGTDSIYTNGDSDCCADCGGQDYLDLSEPAIHSDITPLVALFDSWLPIFGGKQ